MMKQFNGFPARTRYTPLPSIFYSAILPEIEDITELKVTLYTLATLYQKRGYPRFITGHELLTNPGLRECLKGAGEPEEKALARALAMMVRRGTVICVSSGSKTQHDIYLLNTESDRQAAAKIKRGELALPQLPAKEEKGAVPEAAPEATAETPDIFSLYEDNIGMLTPLIADELQAAEKLYPRQWIVDALKEAVSLNKRNWRYIARILEHWSSEGKSNGAYQRYPEKKPDPDKYVRGKYGHIVRR
ncbi:MAG: DnaD domain protein [Chloroflexota bacterium]